jgi:hypothetical protein
LTRVEQDLVAAVVNGDLLDLAGDRPTDEAAMQSWGVSRTIRAWVIRDVVRGRLAPDPDPRGLRLRGARIDGRIDLENIAEDLEVQLRDCLLPEGLLLNDARLLTLSLKGCRIGGRGPTVEAPVHADRFSSRALSLVGATVSGNCAEGVLRLESARIGAVDCSGARLVNDSGPAFHGNGLQVEHNLVLSEGFAADGAGGNGTVCLHEARVGAQFDCSGSRLHNPSGPALACDGMEVGATSNTAPSPISSWPRSTGPPATTARSARSSWLSAVIRSTAGRSSAGTASGPG